MADGRVRIKVQVEDRAVKDLKTALNELESAFESLNKVKPFDNVANDAKKATNEFVGVSDSATTAKDSIDDIDGSSMDDVSQQAEQADSSINDMSDSVSYASDSLSDVDGSSMYDVSQSAEDASESLDGTSVAAIHTEENLADIDGSGMYDVSKTADAASESLGDTAKSADRVDVSLDEVDGDSLQDVSEQANQAGDSLGKTDNKANEFNFSLKDIAKSAVVIKAVSVAFDILKSSMDDAISRFDTLKTYPRTMQLIGYETQEVDRSTRKLVRGIEGLPTKLDDVIQTSQRLGGMTGDLDDATDTTLALNNAFLASGSSAADAARGTEQYIQMLGNGKPDMQSWRTLQETMNYALKEAAESFGFTGVNAVQDFYNALKEGNITFTDFNSRMKELNETQGGFAELALTNAEGIATSWQNIKTAVSRGMETVIKAFDDLSVAVTGKNIAQNLNDFKFVIDDVFGAISSTVKTLSPIIKIAINLFIDLVRVLNQLKPVIYGVAAAFVAFKVITGLISMWTALTTAIDVARHSMLLFEAAQALSSQGIPSLAGLIGTLVSTLTTAAATAGTATGALGALKAVITALSGPIGWIVAGIGALVTAFFTLRKESDETKEVRANIDKMADSTSELNDRIDQTASSYEKSKTMTEAQSESLRELVEETQELAAKEQKSSAEKEILKANIEELNDSVDGLNAAYDEEQGRLTASNDAMSARLDLEEQEKSFDEARERRVEIQEQHAEVTKQLEENQKQLTDAQEHLDGLAWYQSSKEAKEGVEELTEENETLTEKVAFLGEEQKRVDTEISESADALAQAREEANNRVITSMEQLSDSQASVVESMQERYQGLEETTTDMFSRIEERSHMSIEEMNKNLRKNQEAVEKWSGNLKELSEAGVDQGMLEQLARLGPEGAPYVQELVDATPEKLKELENNFKKGGDVAREGLFDSMGIKETDIIEGIPELATRTQTSLKSAIEGAELNRVIPDNLKESKEDMIDAGSDVASGAAQGIKESVEEVGGASRDLGKTATQEFMEELGIKSPSTVFKGHGSDIVEGTAEGIKGNKSAAVSAITDLADELNKTMKTSIDNLNIDSDGGFKKFVKTIEVSFKSAVNTIRTDTTTMQNVTRTGFNGLLRHAQNNLNKVPPLATRTMNSAVNAMRSASSQSQNAGRMLGLGFRNGLSSTAGSIYSLASTIARNAVSRINNALKVRSPSREGFASGDFLGQGLWMGMKSQIRNIEKWSDELGQAALLDKLRPQPLGMSLNPASNLAGASSNNESHTHNNQTFTFNANANGTERNDREFYERLYKEFIWYVQQEGGV